MSTQVPWYALRIQSRMAKVASAVLRSKGYEDFLPTYRQRRRWSDRTDVVDTPLFPGYLFCRVDLRDRHAPVLGTPGIIAFVGVGRTPAPIPEDEIAAVRSIVNSGCLARPWPYFRPGASVRIEQGPLSGVEGTVIKCDDVCRLVVSVDLLQRSIAVEIDREWARQIAGPRDSLRSSQVVSQA